MNSGNIPYFTSKHYMVFFISFSFGAITPNEKSSSAVVVGRTGTSGVPVLPSYLEFTESAQSNGSRGNRRPRGGGMVRTIQHPKLNPWQLSSKPLPRPARGARALAPAACEL